MKITTENIQVGFHARQILKGISMESQDKELVGIIGPNGSGKSTLLKCIYRILKPDAGAVYLDGEELHSMSVKSSARKMAVVAQHNYYNFDFTVREVVLMGRAPHKKTLERDNAKDYRIVEEALKTVQMDAFADRTFSTLSGGEQQRVILARARAQQTPALILDEPTNHLDKRSREKLYDFITSCRITLLVVSHDRTLLNLLASIAELSVGGITLYGGNYDFYKGQKEQEQASMQEKLEAKEKELRRVRKTAREVAERKQKHESRGEKQSVRKGIPRIMMGGLKENAEKSASKLKEVHEDKMENLANELKQMRSSLPDLQGMKLDFSASGLHEGKILVTAKEINFGYAEAGDLWPSPMSFQIKSGERWLIQGDNGSGKTTLLKLITGQLPPRSGSLIRADFSSIYIDQEYSIVRNDRTVYEQAQAFNERHFQEHEIKTLLNRFLFPHDTWEKSCGKLSGGEKMRLAFCCLMISNQTPDLFILDEPTNNLDIQSIEIITSMVRAYRGTILLISHDAYFIRELGIHQIITTFAGRLKTNL